MGVFAIGDQILVKLTIFGDALIQDHSIEMNARYALAENPFIEDWRKMAGGAPKKPQEGVVETYGSEFAV